ncbi:MAG: hypothetical protein LC722_00140 [Actinobacteria bacterium]|nr:hypothetical protein [Actinomycetota bacterium]
MTDVKSELLQAEDARYQELESLLQALDREQKERVGLTDRWSVKDLIGHLGSWCAESCVVLEQIRMGTHERRKLDIEAKNEEFTEVWKDVDLHAVQAELWSSRNRMLEEWGRLEEPNRLAQEWFRESGPKHYEEHLPRLREWVAELTA